MYTLNEKKGGSRIMSEESKSSVVRSKEEKIMALEKKMEQLKARKQKLQVELSQKERKERTRRLIQIGAIFEKYFEIESTEEAEILAKHLQQFPWKNK